MNKLALIVTVLAVILFGVFAFSGITGFTVAKPLDKVKIGDIPLTHNLPLYLALENGYFAQEGLDVELVRFDAPKQIVDAVVLNQVDLGGTGSATGISAIAESKQPGNLKYYAFTCNPEGQGNSLLVTLDSNIKSVKDLRGKKIGHLPGIQWRTIITRILENNEINTSEVTLVDLAVPLQLQALQSKQIDALIALEPTTTIAIEKGIAKNIEPGIATKNVATPFCAGSGIISTKFIRERPQVAQKVLTAMKRAINEYNKEENNPALVEKYLKVEGEIASKIPFSIHKAIYYTDLTLEEKTATQSFLDFFYEEKVIEKRVLLEDVLLK